MRIRNARSTATPAMSLALKSATVQVVTQTRTAAGCYPDSDSSDVRVCGFCMPGYVLAEDKRSCTACEIGATSKGGRGTSCSKCPPGRTTLQEGSHTCTTQKPATNRPPAGKQVTCPALDDATVAAFFETDACFVWTTALGFLGETPARSASPAKTTFSALQVASRTVSTPCGAIITRASASVPAAWRPTSPALAAWLTTHNTGFCLSPTLKGLVVVTWMWSSLNGVL